MSDHLNTCPTPCQDHPLCLVREAEELARLRAEVADALARNVQLAENNGERLHASILREEAQQARAEKAEAEVAEFAAKDYAPMSRIRRAERVSENAVLDKRAAEAELARVNAGRALEQAALSRALPIVTAADAALAALTGEGSASFRARRALTILSDIHDGRA